MVQGSTGRRAVFVDRDGTLSVKGGYCHPDAFQLAPFATEAIRLLNQHGLPVVLVTNQTGLAHGKFTVDALLRSFDSMLDELAQANAHLDAIYYCPHATPAAVAAFDKACPYHKPQPYMLLQAARDLHLDVTQCFMIGDSGYGDMRAGHAAGCTPILVRTGWGQSSLDVYRESWAEITPATIVETVLDAAKWIIVWTAAQPRCTSARTRIVQL